MYYNISNFRATMLSSLMNFNIKNIEEVSIKDLINLAQPNLGEGYLDTEYFNLVFNSEKYAGWAVLNELNQLVAFLAVYKTSNKEVVDKLNDYSIKSELDEQIICIDTMVVHKNYRKKGIGKLLISKTLEKHKKENGYVMYTWSQKGKINMLNIANYFQFKKIKEYHDLWRSDCENGTFNCPALGKEKICCCSTVLYYLKQVAVQYNQ